MENNDVSGSKGPSRRLFLSASAGAATDGTDSLPHRREPDPGLVGLLRQIDPNRTQATIQQLVQFGTRHTASSQTDPNRGIGAATAWVTQQMQAIAATSNGNMTVQQQTFLQQPVAGRLTAPTNITNCIATLQGTASPQRFYVVTGHLDSRVTDILDSTSDAPGADDDGSGVACVLELARLFAAHQFPAPSSSPPWTGRSRACSARPSWRSRWRRRATTSRACSATTSSAPATPMTAAGQTRSPCGCSLRASRPTRPRTMSRSCSRSVVRTTGSPVSP